MLVLVSFCILVKDSFSDIAGIAIGEAHIPCRQVGYPDACRDHLQ